MMETAKTAFLQDWKRIKLSARLWPILLLAFFLTQSAAVQAQFVYTSDGFEVTITGYNGPSGIVVIPATIDGQPVASIGYAAFLYQTDVTGITLPGTIKTIEPAAFAGCANLTSITIPASVEDMHVSAYSACTNLAQINVAPDNLTYSSTDGVWFNKALTRLILCPPGKTGDYIAPAGTLTIDDYAFTDCVRLTGVIIPDSVTSIGQLAFNACNQLTAVAIGKGVTEIGMFPFFNCNGLAEITVAPLNPAFSSAEGILFNHSKTRLITAGAAKSGTYFIPASVTQIEAGAFHACSSLVEVTIPASVTVIGSSVFWGCVSLVTISVSTDNPTYSSLDGVLFDKNRTTLIEYARGKPGSYSIPSTASSLMSHAFTGSKHLTEVIIPGSLTSIGYWALLECPALEAITVAQENPAFASIGGVLYDRNLTNLLQCPGGLTGSYVMPHSVVSIEEYAFSGCGGLTRVTMPGALTQIGDYAFMSCTNLAGITVPASVTNLGTYAFAFCDQLKAVHFMGAAPGFADDVFNGSEELTVYRRAGSSGWGATFGGRPTATWPEMQTADANFGMQADQFGFNLVAPIGSVIIVEASDTPSGPVWSPLQTNTVSGGNFFFSDPQAKDYPSRFYRLRLK